MEEPIVIATWPFGTTAAEAASKVLLAGSPAIDGAVAGCEAVEDDPTVASVGFGGIGNRVGTVSLDACVMDGRTLDCGGVAGVENIRRVARLAKLVAEKTPHVLLVGKGAEWFALQNGFPLELLDTQKSTADWYRQWQDHKDGWLGHDTVTVLTRDRKGHLGGACSTSGLPYKLPGRVGDSPIIGGGLYVDDEVGAAGATGVGEEILRAGGSQIIIEQMRFGKSPQEACELAAMRVVRIAQRRNLSLRKAAFIAIDPKGKTGAACTLGTDFVYAVAIGGRVQTFQAIEIGASS
jgi:N4-(beta-N-acetylglucosaminyl)-L-asparaginase